MKKSEIKQRLEMRSLETSDLSAFNELLRYAFQVTDSDLLKFGWNNEEIKKSKRPILENALVLGWFDIDKFDIAKRSKHSKLISQIALYPMKMNIYNRIYDMGGITGVATYPEYSGIGLMMDLMYEALKIMRNLGQSISCLYPYSIPYYRSRGWEIVSDKMTFSLSDRQMPYIKSVNGMVQRVDEFSPDLFTLHNEFAAQTHGCLVRDNLAWEEYWRWDVEDTIVAIYYDESEKPTGYIVYLLQNDIFYIKEMIYLNEEARHGLWGYIAAHESMFDRIEGANFTNHSLAFLLEDGHIKESISPYIMARIVDVEAFLCNYPFDSVEDSFCLYFIVEDKLLEWNNKTHILYFNKNQVRVEVLDDINNSISCSKHTIKLSIQTLVTMLLGYKRPLYLRSIGRLEANNETINKLESILPEGKAYFSDYF